MQVQATELWKAFLEEVSRNVRAAPWVGPVALLISLACTWIGTRMGGAALTIAVAPWAAWITLIGAFAVAAYDKVRAEGESPARRR